MEKYAAGNKKAFVLPGRTDVFTLALQDLSQDDYDLLNEFLGHTTLLRDRHGRKTFGVFFAVTVIDFRDSAYDVSLVFESVTYDEFVPAGV